MKVGDLACHKVSGELYIVAELPGPDDAQNLIGIIYKCEVRWIHRNFLEPQSLEII